VRTDSGTSGVVSADHYSYSPGVALSRPRPHRKHGPRRKPGHAASRWAEHDKVTFSVPAQPARIAKTLLHRLANAAVVRDGLTKILGRRDRPTAEGKGE